MRAPRLSRLFLSSIAASFLVPASASATTSAFEPTGLERVLSMLVAERSGDYGIAALDLRDGSTVSIRGDTPFPMASTVKLAIAGAYLADVDQGRRTLGDMIVGRPAAKALELMIVRSDNQATDQLLAALGGPVVIQQWLWSHKIAGIRMDRTIAQLLRERGHLADSKDVATPIAMVTLLNKLDNGTVLTAQSRNFLLELMSRCQTGTRRIRALLPAGTRVEDKTGTLDGITNDVGFITMPDGRRVAIVVFARGGRDRQPVIAEVSRAIYDYFADSARSALSLFMRMR
ncbi:beta-lactamase class A [Sphingomonas sp. PP-CE-3G-477]|uniref:serine hydrolase n=2 Tax=Sphingomonas TaxID=13687 RepID=UPI000D371435|nr:serine hydrolase [Sphingomonas sp. PP-CE-3G-477]MBD8620674.1 serine hydrolase [Sphingomonas sp. CFBP 13728]MBE2991434.1 serine hydrolase [Sphingomonas sp. CFBP 13603]PTQ61710.1 beta-lactamase class A [Sphingomonas sp. PP-CE-3G-477]